jgi:hypothetical protein
VEGTDVTETAYCVGEERDEWVLRFANILW